MKPIEFLRWFLSLVAIAYCVFSASALEGDRKIDSEELAQWDCLRYEDLNFHSFEMRGKFPELKKLKAGENEGFRLSLFENSKGLSLYEIECSIGYDGVSYGFNDDKFENLKLHLSISKWDDDANKEQTEVSVDGISPSRLFSLKAVYSEGRLSILMGEEEYKLVYLSPPMASDKSADIIGSVSLEAFRPLYLSSLYLSESDLDLRGLMTGVDVEREQERMSVVGLRGHEGVYRYLDSDLNDKRVVKGGDYTFYLHPVDKDEYELIYISGAKANAASWCPGMLKGKLIPTIFENQYNVVWYDSNGACDFEELWADFTVDHILTIHFPIEKSQLRFYRVPVNGGSTRGDF